MTGKVRTAVVVLLLVVAVTLVLIGEWLFAVAPLGFAVYALFSPIKQKVKKVN
jgi:hypothetical protein